MPYDLGDIVPLSVETRDANGNLANATTVTLTIKKPDATLETPVVTNPSTGVYRCDYTPATAGPYAVKWVATGTNAAAFKDAFDVREDFPPMLFSLSDAKSLLNKVSDADNDKIRELIESTTAIVEGIVGPVVRRSYSEVITGSGNLSYFTTGKRPIISVTSITPISSYGPTYDPADFDIDQENGVVRELYERAFVGTHRVTYVVGRSFIPAAIRDAGRYILKWLWASQLGPHRGPMDMNAATAPGTNPGIRLGREIPQYATELLREYAQIGGFA